MAQNDGMSRRARAVCLSVEQCTCLHWSFPPDWLHLSSGVVHDKGELIRLLLVESINLCFAVGESVISVLHMILQTMRCTWDFAASEIVFSIWNYYGYTKRLPISIYNDTFLVGSFYESENCDFYWSRWFIGDSAIYGNNECMYVEELHQGARNTEEHRKTLKSHRMQSKI